MKRELGERVALTGRFLFAGAVFWCFLPFGSTPTWALLSLFLLLLLPVLVGSVGVGFGDAGARRQLVVGIVGAVLLLHVVFRPSLEARGYVHAAVGWLGLYSTLLLVGHSRRRMGLVVRWLLAVGAFEALYGLVQVLGGVDAIGSYERGLGRIASGTLINPNHFARFLNLMIALAIGGLASGYARKRGSRGRRSEAYAFVWVVVLGTALMGSAVLLSASRGGTISLVATLGFLSMLLTLARRREARGGLHGAAAWVVVVVVVTLGLGLGIDQLLADLREGGVGGRAIVYRDTIELIAENPWLGVGPGLYGWRMRPYQSVSLGSRWVHAESDYFQIAAARVGLQKRVPGSFLRLQP